MAIGSTPCRGQRHGVGTEGERGTERRGEQKGSTAGAVNGQGMAKGESDRDEEANREGKKKRQPLVGSAKEYRGFYEGGSAD